jgi:lipopolysaccharide assembly outer membrane protein LptD (OstA)
MVGFIGGGMWMKRAASLALSVLLICSSPKSSFPQEEKESILIEQEEEGGYFSFEEGDVFSGIGRIRIIHRDVVIEARKIRYEMKKGEIVAEGGVLLKRGEEEIRGERISYDVNAGTGTARDVKIHVEPWYGGAEEVSQSNPSNTLISKGYLTTCDLEKPHYKFYARKVDIKAEERLIARDVIFYLFDIPVLYIPFYYRSLKDKRSKFVLEPGYSKAEGLFIRAYYNYNIGENIQGRARTEVMSKKGIGVGMDLRYTLGRPSDSFYQYPLDGTIYTYYIKEKDTGAKRWWVRAGGQYRIFESAYATFNADYSSDERVYMDYSSGATKLRLLSSRGFYANISKSGYGYYVSANMGRSEIWDDDIGDFRKTSEILPQLQISITPRSIGSFSFGPVRGGIYPSISANAARRYVPNPVSKTIPGYWTTDGDLTASGSANVSLGPFLTASGSVTVRESGQTRSSLAEDSSVVRGTLSSTLSLNSYLRNFDLSLSHSYSRKLNEMVGRSISPYSSYLYFFSQNRLTGSGGLRFGNLGRVRISTSYDMTKKGALRFEPLRIYGDMMLGSYSYGMRSSLELNWDVVRKALTSLSLFSTLNLGEKGFVRGNISYQKYSYKSSFQPSLSASIQATRNWRLSGDIQLDLSEKRVRSIQVEVVRTLHCWESSLSLRRWSYYRTGGETQLWFRLYIKAFPQFGIIDYRYE